MIANCLTDDPVSSLAEKNSEDGSTASNSLVNLAVIGKQPTNEDEDDIMQEGSDTDSTCGKEEDLQAQKSVQSIQMFENGEFITKYLEVETDADVPRNRINGTIEYSSDYRLAESPKFLVMPGLPDYTSSSDQSTNGNNSGSDTSEKSGNSLAVDQFESSQEAAAGRLTVHSPCIRTTI